MEKHQTEELIDKIEDFISRKMEKAEEHLKDSLTEQITAYLDRLEEANYKAILTTEETTEYLGVSSRNLSNWAKTGVLPRYKLGGKYYWKLKDIFAYLKIDS